MHPITKLLEEQVRGGATPAVQYMFVSYDSVLFAHSAGMANLGSAVPAQRGTTYHGFSVTKTFTAVAVLQLVEQGFVDLDRAVLEYLPSFPYGPDITVRQLLNHTAGIPNPIPLSWIHLESEHAGFSRDDFFRGVLQRHPRIKEKGNVRFRYSNLGYVLLGQLIEQVSGMTYEGYVAQNVVGRLGIDPSELGFSIKGTNQAVGYQKRWSFGSLLLGFFIDKPKFMESPQGAWRPFRRYYVNGTPYGGLVGSVDGFARYAQALLSPGSPLLSEQSRRSMFQENILADGSPSGMGLSWFTGALDGHRYYAHAGGGGGYYLELRIYPELRRGSVVAFNRTGMRDERFLNRLDQYVLNGPAPPHISPAH